MANLKSISRFSTFSGRINLVPMIDIVFQLLVFFMVAAHLATASREVIKLPQPVHSQAREKQLENQLVINLLSDGSGRIMKIKANSDLVRDLPGLVDMLLRYGPRLQANKGTVVLRADRTMQFAQIEKVLQAIGNAGITSVHVAAEQDKQVGAKGL
ncbi:MAG: biopolymer transporter ExbD [Phycisphaerae bacterium]